LTTLRGLQYAFKVRRLRGNIWGLGIGYGAVMLSMAGKGCRRDAVRKEVYHLTHRSRKKSLFLKQTESLLSKALS
jgi:hypothetical protein